MYIHFTSLISSTALIFSTPLPSSSPLHSPHLLHSTPLIFLHSVAAAQAIKEKAIEEEKEDEKDKEKEKGMDVDKEREKVVLEDNTTQVTDGDREEEDEELRRWGMERLTTSRDTFLDAIEICDRLAELPEQLKGIGKEKGRERVLRLRVGDIEGLRRGVEAFVGGIPAPAGTSTSSGSIGSSSSSGVSGWGGGQTGVVDRIIGNRPLLAGVYGITNGLEEILNLQRDRMEQRDYDGQRSDDARGVGSVNERSVWRDAESSWDTKQAQAQAEAQQRDGMRGEREVEDEEGSGVVPEGLVKETKTRSDDSEALIEGNLEAEEGRVSMNDKAEREVAVAVKTPPPPLPPTPVPSAAVWSPGAAVIPVSISPTPPPPPPPAVSVNGRTVNGVTSADADAAAAAVTSAPQQRNDVIPYTSTVVENRGGEVANTEPDRAPSHQDIDGKDKENEKVVEREVPEEALDDIKGDDESKEGLSDVYFLSILDDSNNDDKQYSSSSRSSSSRSRFDGGSGERDSSVFDTTIESTRDRDADQIILFLTTSLDVMFFLLETIAKASGPIILGGGAVAVERASDALFADTISPKSFLKKNNKSKDNDRDKSDPKLGTLDSSSVSNKDATVKTWKLLSEFKQQI
jgi:hypothetical protein